MSPSAWYKPGENARYRAVVANDRRVAAFVLDMLKTSTKVPRSDMERGGVTKVVRQASLHLPERSIRAVNAWQRRCENGQGDVTMISPLLRDCTTSPWGSMHMAFFLGSNCVNGVLYTTMTWLPSLQGIE